MWDHFTKYDWGLKLQEFLYSLESDKIINKTNSIIKQNKLPSLKPNLFNSSTLRALDKVCGKLISRKLVLRDVAQLKTWLQSQLARGSRENLKIHENAISNHPKQSLSSSPMHYNWRTSF